MTRRIVLIVAALIPAGLIASCSPCVSSGAPADAIPKVVLADGGMGDPCGSAAQCSAGLECTDTFALSDTYVEAETTRSCTRECNTTACPSGFVCIDSALLTPADGGATSKRICAPGCRGDADCQTGKRAGTCVGAVDGGTSADGGTDAGVPSADGLCLPLVCGGRISGSCPTGFTCQDDDYGGTRYPACNGGTSNAARAAPMGAWCGR